MPVDLVNVKQAFYWRNMNTKINFPFIISIIITLLITACQPGENVDKNQVAVVVALTQTAAAIEEVPSAPEFGTISGSVHLQAPPTPALTVYALDESTGEWFSVDTPESELAASFTLEVKPGSYMLFAFPPGLGYSLNGFGLTPVTVTAGQEISDIRISPPSQSECGSTFGIPASPDGRYAEIPGPSTECLAGDVPAYVPLDPTTCTELSEAISSRLGLPVEVETPVEFEDFVTQKSGSGCQMTFLATGQTAKDLNYLNIPADTVLDEFGWKENQAYAAGGAGGFATAYQKNGSLCLLYVSVGPLDENICPPDQPFFECMNSLTPEQRKYTLVLNCAQER